MRNLALGCLGFGVLVVALVAMSPPPIDRFVEGQAKCGNDICMGSPGSKVHLKGSTSFENTAGAAAFTRNPDGGLSALTTADNAIATTTKALINYDFPAAQFKVDAFSCVDSPTATIANCPFGSQLLLGVDQALAAGGTGTLNPYLSAANTVFVRECAIAGDAGVFNMPDASYLVRCIP